MVSTDDSGPDAGRWLDRSLWWWLHLPGPYAYPHLNRHLHTHCHFNPNRGAANGYSCAPNNDTEAN
jgi:hypothetical protein